MQTVIYEDRPSTRITLTLPDRPGIEISGPGEMDNDVFFEIQSKAMKTHLTFNEKTGEMEPISYYDENARAWAMVSIWIELQETSWNIGDKDGNVRPRTRATLSKVFKLTDVLHLAGELNKQLWSQVEPEGNAAAGPTSNSKETENSEVSSETARSRSARTGSSAK